MALEFTFSCPLAAGLHARPASLLSETAQKAGCECTLTNLRTQATANLKSALAIIAADVRSRDACRVVCDGADETSAYASLRGFIEKELPDADDAVVPAQAVASRLPRALREAGCRFLTGTGVSPGIGIGRAVYAGQAAWPTIEHSHEFVNPELERERVTLAFAAVVSRMRSLLARAKSKTESGILDAHVAILRDVSLTAQVHDNISRGDTAEQAVVHAAEHFRDVLRASPSAMIRERALDLQDVARRLLEELGAVAPGEHALKLAGPSIVFAEDLTPQELLAMDRKLIAGMVLEYAGATSHTVILARSLGIPVLAGVVGAQSAFAEGDTIVVDATRGVIVGGDSREVERFYACEIETQRRHNARLSQSSSGPATTIDGRTLEVAANVSSPLEVRAAFEVGADGVGVYRTEMLFVDRAAAPTEEEQFEIYAEAARAASGKPVILRTLDIGGDKRVPHLNLPEEPNPFLGYRGARIYAEHVDLFRTQVRAILRASAFGHVQIMLPMISNAAEVRWAREQVAQVRQELEEKGIAAGDVPLGIMIEVPAVGYAIAELSEVAEFFSVGTNDLSQYFFVADRGNARVWPLANAIQPAFLRFLKYVVDEVRAHKRWIGICGEMGGEIALLPLMLGLGFDEISATVPNVTALKQCVGSLRQEDCEKLLKEAIACRTAEEVSSLLERAQLASRTVPLLDRELVVIGSDSRNKEEAIQELVDTVYVAGRTDDRQALEDAVWEREATYSTALGFGFAIPHCKNDAVIADSIAVLKLAKPIAWDEEDVEFAILLAMRESAKENAHMQLFSRLARKLMNEDFRAQLAAAKDVDAVIALLSAELAVAR